MSLRVVSPFFDNDVYITAVVKKIQEKLDNLDFSIDAIIFSYHGLPVDYCLKGDPYEVQCEETTRLLKFVLFIVKLIYTLGSFGIVAGGVNRLYINKWRYTNKNVLVLVLI